MFTEKLYYTDSHMFEFTATVLDCRDTPKGPALILDRTVFFPEGGGQQADTGSFGGVNILDVHEKDGEILHYCDRPLPAGETAEGRIDAEQRLVRMQNHSGEHVVSGLAHQLYGCENVGFHMGEDFVTIDFDRELSWEQLMEIEERANRVVRDDLPVLCTFPEPEELKNLEYRSKLELTENVRIVEIPGTDCCACCAPHVKHTGEIGLIKVLESERHRGGVRLNLACGMLALFVGVTNCPISTLLIGFEMFGYEAMPYFVLSIAVSFTLSGYYGLYSSQKFAYSKIRTEYINRKTET